MNELCETKQGNAEHKGYSSRKAVERSYRNNILANVDLWERYVLGVVVHYFWGRIIR